MNHRRIVIGDVHGHYDALKSLLKEVAPQQNDQIYFLGDLIDRGSQSAQLVEFVIQNNYPCLLGNHEQMLIEAVGYGEINSQLFQAWLYSGGHSTILSYNNKIPQEHIDWFKKLPLYLDLGDIWLVHAGVDPTLTLDEQTSEEFCWIREPFHRSTKPYFPDKLIVTGHTITFTLPGVKPGKIAAGPGWLNIETGAYHPKSGWLTALDLTEEQVYQFNTQDGSSRTIPLKKAVNIIKPSLISSRKFNKNS